MFPVFTYCLILMNKALSLPPSHKINLLKLTFLSDDNDIIDACVNSLIL